MVIQEKRNKPAATVGRIRIGIIGDFDPDHRSHRATNEALLQAAEFLSLTLEASWIPTESLAEGPVKMTLNPFDGLWSAPGSPYRSMAGALRGIRFARERGWPFLGT